MQKEALEGAGSEYLKWLDECIGSYQGQAQASSESSAYEQAEEDSTFRPSQRTWGLVRSAFEGDDPLSFIADPGVRDQIWHLTRMTKKPEEEQQSWALAAYYSQVYRKDIRFCRENLQALNEKWFEKEGISVGEAYGAMKKFYRGEIDWSKSWGQFWDDTSAMAKAITGKLMKGMTDIFYTGVQAAMTDPQGDAMNKLFLSDSAKEAYDAGVRGVHEGVARLHKETRDYYGEMADENSAKVLDEDWVYKWDGGMWLPNLFRFLTMEAPSQAVQIYAAYTMGPLGFTLAMGGSSGLEKYYDLADSNLPEEQRVKNAMLTGVINSGLAWVTAGMVKGKIPGMKRVDLLTRNRDIVKYFVTAFGIEATQEAVEQLAENATDIYTGVYGDPKKMSPQEFRKHLWKGVPESALAGGSFGFAAAGTGYGSAHEFARHVEFVDRKNRQTVTDLTGKMDKGPLPKEDMRKLEIAQLIVDCDDPGKKIVIDRLAEGAFAAEEVEEIRQSDEFKRIMETADEGTTEEMVIQSILAERQKQLRDMATWNYQDTVDEVEKFAEGIKGTTFHVYFTDQGGSSYGKDTGRYERGEMRDERGDAARERTETAEDGELGEEPRFAKANENDISHLSQMADQLNIPADHPIRQLFVPNGYVGNGKRGFYAGQGALHALGQHIVELGYAKSGGMTLQEAADNLLPTLNGKRTFDKKSGKAVYVYTPAGSDVGYKLVTYEGKDGHHYLATYCSTRKERQTKKLVQAFVNPREKRVQRSVLNQQQEGPHTSLPESTEETPSTFDNIQPAGEMSTDETRKNPREKQKPVGIPDEVWRYMKRKGIENARAFYYNGEVYLNGDRVRPSEVRAVLTHEVVGHKGLRALVGEKRLNELLDAVYREHYQDEAFQQVAKRYNLGQEVGQDAARARAGTDEYGEVRNGTENAADEGTRREAEVSEDEEGPKLWYSVDDVVNQRIAAEEYLAHLAESGRAKPSWWREFLQKIRMMLSRIPWFRDVKMSDREIETLLARSARAMRKRMLSRRSRVDLLSDETRLRDASPRQGGEDPRFSIGGEVGAGKMRDAEERLSNLSIAKQMAQEGKDARAIKLATGWEKGGDGKWRFELPDLAPKKDWKYILLAKSHPVLKDIVDAKELFEAYPELAETPVKSAIFRDEAGKELNSVFGMYDDEEDCFYVSAQNLAKFEITDFWETLVHEVQHKIQRIEGFAKGGNPQQFQGKSEALKPEVEAFRKKADASEKYRRKEELDREFAKILADGTDEKIDAWNEKYGEEYEALEKDPEVKAIEEEKSDILKRYGNNLRVLEVLKDPENEKAWKAIALDDDLYRKTQYRRLAGEVEARNAQKRLYLTAEQKRKKLLADTEDVSEEDKIYLERQLSGKSEMSPLRPENAPNNADNGTALRDNNVPYAAGFMEWAGLQGNTLYADYEFLYARHWTKDGKSPYFNSQEEVRAAVELVLSKPEQVKDMAGGKNASFVGFDEETGAIYRIEIEKRVRGKQNHIRSVFEITPEQYRKIKLEPSRVLQPSHTRSDDGIQHARTISSFLRYDTPKSAEVKLGTKEKSVFSDGEDMAGDAGSGDTRNTGSTGSTAEDAGDGRRYERGERREERGDAERERTKTAEEVDDAAGDLRFMLSDYSEADIRDIVAILRPFAGTSVYKNPKDYSKYLAEHGVKDIPEKDAFGFADLAARENNRAAQKRAAKERDQWLYENNLLWQMCVDYCGTTDFKIKPDDGGGEKFTGTFISPEFVQYSEKRPQGKNESDKKYYNYLVKREKELRKAKGFELSDIAKYIAEKMGWDELDVKKQLIDYFRDLKKPDLYHEYHVWKKKHLAATQADHERMFDEYMRQEKARIEDEVVEVLQRGQPIDLAWIDENREVYKELYRQLFPDKEKAPFAPGKADLEAINAALMQEGSNAADYAKAYKEARKKAFAEYMEALRKFRDKVMQSKADAIRLQKDALDFAEKYLRPEERGEFARDIVRLLEYSTEKKGKYLEGRRMFEFQKLLKRMTERAGNARRDAAVQKIRDLLERYRVQRKYKGQPVSKLPSVQSEVNEIRKIFNLRPEALAAYRAMNMAEMNRHEENSDPWNEARKKLALTELFGYLPQKTANEAEAALKYLETLTTGGRENLLEKMHERLDRLDNLRGQLINNLTGGIVDTRGKDAKKFRDKSLKQRARLESLIQIASGLSVEEFEKSDFGKIVRAYNEGQENELTTMRRMDKDVHDAVERIFKGYKGVFGFGRFLKELTKEEAKTGVFRTIYTAKVKKGSSVVYHIIGKRPAMRAKVNWRIAEAALGDAGNKAGDLLVFEPWDKETAQKQLSKFGDCKDDFAIFMVNGKLTVYAFDAKSMEVSKFEPPMSELSLHYNTYRITDIGRRFAQRQVDDCSAGVRPIDPEFGNSTADAEYQALQDDGKFAAEVQFIADPPGLESSREELTNLSRDQALQLILTWEQDEYKDTMRWNGFDEETMRQLYDFVGEKYLAFGRWMRDYESQKSGLLDELSKKKYGVGLPKIVNYHPGRFEGVAGQTIREDRKSAIGGMSMNPSFLIARRGHLKAPDVNAGAFSVFRQHLQNQTHFMELDDVVGDLRGIFNDSKVKNTINAELGADLTNEIQRRISSLATSSSQDLAAAKKIFGKTYRHFVPAKLALSIPSMLKQGAGSLNYMEKIPMNAFWKYYSRSMTNQADFREFRRWAWKSDYMQNRWAGGMDPDLVYLANHTLDSEKYDPLLNLVMDQAMIPTKLGDAFATIYGGYTVYAYTRDQALRNGATALEAEKLARYAWMKATDETQQGSKLTNKNFFMENAGVNRFLTMFMTNPIQTMDLVMQSIDEVRLGRGGAEARKRLARQLFVSHFVIPTAMFAITQAWRHGFDVDEWNWEEYVIDLLFGSFEGCLYMSFVMEAAEAVIKLFERKRVWRMPGERSVPVIEALWNVISTTDRLSRKDELQPSDIAAGVQALGDSLIFGGQIDNRVGTVGSVLSALGLRSRQILRWFEDKDER